ncbi:neuroendocrine protein 7B2 [Tribolium castaneum]|uniref:Neuroendocrine protein 7B2 n=1 Tax=Tribolium castaneum TaxID=7070 RepID=D2A238_TRICA|nr:PREDICTED: uncharacterized protein LOC662508 [Tribolium castaneum]EFA02732.2 Neuroendocrine protein 7B2-like Protein [Tribolium castaneum]|eukprot:XP_973692.1 PREDICTED: uncharacterized protein LOC662508 [Tribolium castaneum]
MILAIVLWSVAAAFAYIPDGKDNFMPGVFLREIVNRMNKDLPDLAYMDFPENRLPLGVRSLGREMEEEPLFPLDYEALGEPNIHPSIRDQEFLEHSSLYGSQFMSGGAGEGKQRLRPQGTIQNIQEIKSDSTLPAYCNPPNPCPVGYTAEQGCIEKFENTASYSRRYQAAQDCMCDTEHMFECPNPNPGDSDDDSFNDLEFNQFLQHTMQMNPGLQHKNLVAKKFHQYARTSGRLNPFLSGERLPVAAKKGNNVVF